MCLLWGCVPGESFAGSAEPDVRAAAVTALRAAVDYPAARTALQAPVTAADPSTAVSKLFGLLRDDNLVVQRAAATSVSVVAHKGTSCACACLLHSQGRTRMLVLGMHMRWCTIPHAPSSMQCLRSLHLSWGTCWTTFTR